MFPEALPLLLGLCACAALHCWAAPRCFLPEALVDLMAVVVRLCPSVCASSHFAVLLGAYGASLSILGECGDGGWDPGGCGDRGWDPGRCGDRGWDPGECGDQGWDPGGSGDQGVGPGAAGTRGCGFGVWAQAAVATSIWEASRRATRRLCKLTLN